MLKIGIIREEKVPPDSRVPLTPQQCALLNKQPMINVEVESSATRCFSDEEYRHQGVEVVDTLSPRDLLLGVKEVPIDKLMEDQTYCFFSHTTKKQPYNRELLRAILNKRIRLLDYEMLTNEQGQRLIAFGVFAGMVGAHNGILTYGRRTGDFDLPRMKDLQDYAAAREVYKKVSFPPMRVVLTGTGRVGQGAARVLEDMGLKRVSPEDFLNKDFEAAIFTQLSCGDYVAHHSEDDFDKQHFYDQPSEYVSVFSPYTQRADVFINGIYWDNEAPAFFTQEEATEDDWSIQVIADVTCDIAPDSSIPATLEASTIADPIFGYDPRTGEKSEPYQEDVIDMMTIDNLPNELPRDASESFGQQFIENILPEFFETNSKMLERATVAVDGHLGTHFKYLTAYVRGEE